MDTARTAIQLARSAPATQASLQPGLDGVANSRLFRAYQAEPLAQRPAGSTGKQGVCQLVFAVRSGKTRLGHSLVSHPFHCTHPWYLDPALPGMAVVYVQSPGGGLIHGDRAALRFELGPAAQVHITTPAAEKIHTMTANCALQQIAFNLGPGAYAEYCSEPLILFPGARFGQTLQIQLASGASFFGTEIVLFRSGSDMETFTAFSASLSVLDADGSLLVRDQGHALPAHQSLSGPLAGYCVWGQALLVGPDIPADWTRGLHDRLPTQEKTVWGVSRLPQERGISIKVVGSEVWVVRQVLAAAWNLLRLRHLGVPAPRFPK